MMQVGSVVRAAVALAGPIWENTTPDADKPPHFTLTFVAFLVGMAVFLVGGGLVRNAFVPGPYGTKGALDHLLEAHFYPLQFLGLAVLVFAYPFFAIRRGLPLWPWLVLLLGTALAFGPMLYWAWWHGQI